MDMSLLKHGMVSWVELLTSDVAAAKQFYQKLFGWTFTDSHVPGYQMISVGERAIGGIMKTPPEAAGMPPAWSQYVTVDNIDEIASQVQAMGGKLLMPPMDIPQVGRFSVFQDPQGATIAAIQYRSDLAQMK